ncbi:hypothetical protein GCM10028868_35490 [Virgibacillus kimchii]
MYSYSRKCGAVNNKKPAAIVIAGWFFIYSYETTCVEKIEKTTIYKESKKSPIFFIKMNLILRCKHGKLNIVALTSQVNK